MLPDLTGMGCGELAVPATVMAHVVAVESSFNPFAIGVVGSRLQRQPRTLSEAIATAAALESGGRNFSVGLAQVNRHNLARQGLHGWASAFDACANLLAGARILADCHMRAKRDWPRAFSCYYSGNFDTGFRHGYVDRVVASMARAGLAHDRGAGAGAGVPIPLVPTPGGDIRLAPARVATGTSQEALRHRRGGTRAAGSPRDPAPPHDPAPSPPDAAQRDDAFVF